MGAVYVPMPCRLVVTLMFKVRIRGVNNAVRSLAKIDDAIHDAAREGCNEAAWHLLDVIKGKFGVYNTTGGPPGGYGRWPKLKFETRKKKVRKYGADRGPLIASGKTVGSLTVVEGGKGRLAASVSADSDYLIHHVYGAPGANVPMRDPMRVTALEEKDKCTEIIMKHIDDALKGIGL